MKMKTPLLLTALAASVSASQAHGQIASALTAADTASPSTGLNLTSYTNAIQGDGNNVWNPVWLTPQLNPVTEELEPIFGDSFTVMARGLTGEFDIIQQVFADQIPFALTDNSLSIFPTDSVGIIKENDTAPFFGVVDTDQSSTGSISNPNVDPVTATWVFDISSATSDVAISIDLAAMGDFEDADAFSFSVGLDGGTQTQVGTFAAATDIDDFAYTLEGGAVELLNDPMQFDGTTLTNNFATFSLGTIAGSSSASTLELSFTADTNGGSEALAFRNIIIAEAGSPVVPGDTDGDGDVDDADLGTSFANYTGPLAPGTGGKTAADGDTDGDGDVDDADLGTSFAGYTGPLTAAVPEPASLALLGLGGLLVARRRRA